MVLHERDKVQLLLERFQPEDIMKDFDVHCEKCRKKIHVKVYKGKRGGLIVWLWDGIFHHKDGNRSNDFCDNIELVCYRCHNLIHRIVKRLGESLAKRK